MAKVTDLSLNEFPSLSKKIRITFLLLTGLMFVFFWGLIYIAEDQLEVISLEHKLSAETAQYQRLYRRLGEKSPLPDPNELLTYWSKKSLPNWLQTYQEVGFYEHELENEDKHFLISEHPSGQGLLYLVYKDNADDYLDPYEDRLHLLVLFLGAMLLVAVLAYGLYFVRTLSAPLAEIERKINLLAPDSPDFKPATGYRETRRIEHVLLANKAKIAAYFIREQEFSRFASHELRTPIMVIQGSTDLLKKLLDPKAIDANELSQASERRSEVINKAITRLTSASQQMTVLTEAFLLLGKEHLETQHLTPVELSQRLTQILDEMTQYSLAQQVGFQLNQTPCAPVLAPQSWVDIVITNLLKNAFSYSIGPIAIHLAQGSLRISNQHNGNDLDNAGFGCGLIIVARVCERMNWHFLTENDGKTFIATVQFFH